MDCQILRNHVDSYVDAELGPSPSLEIDQHLNSCEQCREEVNATRVLKRALAEELSNVRAPAALRARISTELASHDYRSRGDSAPISRPAGTALALAATVLLALVGVWGHSGRDTAHSSSAAMSTSEASAASLPIVQDIVDQHMEESPADMEAETPERAATWFRGRVDFRVRSVEFPEPNVRFLGARVTRIGNHRAAKLYYNVGDSRLTLIVFPSTPQIHSALQHSDVRAGQPSQRVQVGNRQVTYQVVHGYTVPMFEDNGIVYAFTGDIDQTNLLRLVGSARMP